MLSIATPMRKPKIKKRLKTSKELALFSTKLALDKKAFNPILLDVRPWQTLMDYVLIVSAQSTKQAQAISGYICETLKKDHIFSLGTEGVQEGKWILMDYNEVVIHVFFDYVRDVYDLEGFWQDAQRIKIPKEYYQSHVEE